MANKAFMQGLVRLIRENSGFFFTLTEGESNSYFHFDASERTVDGSELEEVINTTCKDYGLVVLKWSVSDRRTGCIITFTLGELTDK